MSQDPRATPHPASLSEKATQAPDIKIAELFTQLCRTIAQLRHPTAGCPWDLKQTHASLRRYMLEEAYEAAATMQPGVDPQELCDELGDVLLQVVLNSQLACDAGTFDITKVLAGIQAKMIRRHPHVFKAQAEPNQGQHLNPDRPALSDAELKQQWNAIKAQEAKSTSTATSTHRSSSGVFAKADSSAHLPATSKARKIGEIAASINFDWDDPKEVFAKLQEEVAELKEAIQQRDDADIESELGDVYFSLAQLCRHLKLDPEVTAEKGNRKFLDRFARIETLLEERPHLNLADLSRSELEHLWLEAKARQNRKP